MRSFGMMQRSSRWYALVCAEFAFVALLFWLDMQRTFSLHKFAFLLFSKTPWLVLLSAVSVKLDGRGWRALGWRRPQIGWPRVFAIGMSAGIAMEALELFVTQPLLERCLHQPPDLNDILSIAGNTTMFLVALALTWSLAAFGEEIAWRGYMLNRIAEVLGSSGAALAVAVIASSALFGLAHFPQGPTGMIENGIDGALLCAVFLLSGRNLFAAIVAHGITDTVDVLLIYTRHYPGLH